MEEFVTIGHQVACDDVTLMDGFLCGLEDLVPAVIGEPEPDRTGPVT